MMLSIVCVIYYNATASLRYPEHRRPGNRSRHTTSHVNSHFSIISMSHYQIAFYCLEQVPLLVRDGFTECRRGELGVYAGLRPRHAVYVWQYDMQSE